MRLQPWGKGWSWGGGGEHESSKSGPNGHTGCKEPKSSAAQEFALVLLLQKQALTFLL